jgi:ribonuclease HI
VAEQKANRVAGAEVCLYFDGFTASAKAPAGIGMVLTTAQGDEIMAWGGTLGEVRAEVGQYQALVHGLEEALQLEAGSVRLMTDSEPVVQELTGRREVAESAARPLHRRATGLLERFESWSADLIDKEQNQQARSLARRYAELGDSELEYPQHSG